MRELSLTFDPHIWVNVHSGMEALFMPYDHKNTTSAGLQSQKMKLMLETSNNLHCGDRCVVGLGGGSVGYQPPSPADQVKVVTDFEFEGEGSPTARGRGRGGRGRGRGRGRGGFRNLPGNGYAPAENDDGGWDAPRDFTRGRGRGGRGRNFGGRGRGGYNNGPYVDDQYDGEYNQEAPMQGRGRGRGRGTRARGCGFRSNGPILTAAVP